MELAAEIRRKCNPPSAKPRKGSRGPRGSAHGVSSSIVRRTPKPAIRTLTSINSPKSATRTDAAHRSSALRTVSLRPRPILAGRPATERRANDPTAAELESFPAAFVRAPPEGPAKFGQASQRRIIRRNRFIIRARLPVVSTIGFRTGAKRSESSAKQPPSGDGRRAESDW